MPLRNFTRNESGATAIEYGLIAACIFLGMVMGFRLFANQLTNSINDTSNKVQNATKN